MNVTAPNPDEAVVYGAVVAAVLNGTIEKIKKSVIN